MKNNVLILLMVILMLSTIATAGNHSLTIGYAGFGADSGGYAATLEKSSPHRWLLGGGYYTFIEFMDAGNLDVNLAFCNEQGTTTTITCSSLNITGGVAVWTQLTPDYSTTCGGGVYAWNYTQWNVSSNTGIIRCSSLGGTGNLALSYDSSYVNQISPDYSFRNFTAGSEYTIPLVNKYALPHTVISTGENADFQENYNTAGYYLATYTPSCLQDNGTAYIDVGNYNTQNESQSTGYFLNSTFNELTEFTINSYIPSAPTSITSGQVNFSITTNNPLAVDYISWYVDGELVQYSTTNYNFNYTFTTTGQYLVEAQLEDNDCGRYPTVNFTVNAGKIITLSGYVKEYGTTTPIEDVAIGLNGGDCLGDCVATTDSTGYYSIAVTKEANYTISAYKYGYDTETASKSMTYGSFYNTQYNQNFNLKTSSRGFANIWAYDYDTNALLYNYQLDVYRAGQRVITIINGIVTYHPSTTNQLVTSPDNPTFIENMSLGYTYTATITKSGYQDSGEAGKLSTFNWVQTSGTNQVYVYLKQMQNHTTTASVNWSDLSPVSGTLINITDTPEVTIRGTATTDSGSYYLCVHWQESGYGYQMICTDEPVTGTRTHGVTIGLMPDTLYTYYFEAFDGVNVFNSSINYFTTTGGEYPNPSTTSTSIYVVTTTTIYHLPTNQTPFNWTHTEREYNCTEPWGLIKNDGDWYHGSICAYVKPLGVDWTYGLTFILIIMFVYVRTQSSLAVGIISLIITATFYEYMPQPTLILLAIGLAFGIGFGVYGLFFEPFKKEKDAYMQQYK